MDSLLLEAYSQSINIFKFSPELHHTFLNDQISVGNKIRHHDTHPNLDYVEPQNDPGTQPTFFNHQISITNKIRRQDPYQDLDHVPSIDPNHDLGLIPGVIPDGEITEVPDFSDACLKYMTEILMEEGLEDTPSNLEDYNALQATEKALYDALGEAYPPSSNQFPPFLTQSVECPEDAFYYSPTTHGNDDHATTNQNVAGSNWAMLGHSRFLPSESNSHSSAASIFVDDAVNGLMHSPVGTLLATEATSEGNVDWNTESFKYVPNITGKCKPGGEGGRLCRVGNNEVVHELRGRKNHHRDDSDCQDLRSNKHIAAYDEECIQMEQYDDILLCWQFKDGISVSNNRSFRYVKLPQNGNFEGSKGRSTRGKRQSSNKEEIVDLTTLLTQCAQAVASFDIRTANDLLQQIRQHSSSHGDSNQRLANYLADGLEARLAGTGAQLSADVHLMPFSGVDALKANQVFASAVPFKRTSYFLANHTILKLAQTATRIHIVDFGIFYGFQWPCFIQKLSKRPNGPPELRITGIDFPQRGFRPAKVVEETGRRLAGYCDRFNVPFKYHSIAQKWETIRPEDLKIDKDELVVVNCMYQSTTLLDETVDVNSPRDAFLGLVKNLNPDLFIQGTINVGLSAPFFITRFREAMFFYSSVFDLFEATITCEDHARLVMERDLHGKALLNVIACEGAERVVRPETYKQWQIRMLRSGFRQLPLNQELVSRAKDTVKANYHKDFVVGEDSHWMLQGWKGRILFTLSCWKPA
ncbi:hypothetical protein Nepgr_014106 [Nepenthes gracilis]|uniref:Uncharacterized protein n=1 Tax=Nepenthes gracilis TaxID=150966 RepID=A0AAD3SK35_NEPGR|nr:hypothetical protein Nepgr_014106 [Nepenthes gracilis]